MAPLVPGHVEGAVVHGCRVELTTELLDQCPDKRRDALKQKKKGSEDIYMPRLGHNFHQNLGAILSLFGRDGESSTKMGGEGSGNSTADVCCECIPLLKLLMSTSEKHFLHFWKIFHSGWVNPTLPPPTKFSLIGRIRHR